MDVEKRDYRKKPLKIFIAIGHGGSDPGAVYGGWVEKHINQNIATLMEADLQRHGVQVRLSRYVDEEDRLIDEIVECNEYAPDFAVEIHTNAGGGTGFEVYYQMEPWSNSKLSVTMANLFDENVSKYLNVSTRGLKTNNNLGWLKRVKAPCILVENFFIDGPKVNWYASAEQIKKLSKAYARALLDFYDIPYLPDGLQYVRYDVLSEDGTVVKQCSCPGMLVQGNHLVHERLFGASLDKGVLYDSKTRRQIVYPKKFFAVSEISGELLRLNDYPSRAERVMAGLPTDDLEDADAGHCSLDNCKLESCDSEHERLDGYSFDEYDYNEAGRLEQSQWLTQ